MDAEDRGERDTRASGAPGWRSIDAALASLYGGQEPARFGTAIRHALGGPDPLDGISAYRRTAPVPHWHFVTYGLSELYEKDSDDPATSGYGFELTLRLRRADGAGEPPSWALHFLQNLARYVFSSGNAFAAGHHVDLNGPIALDAATAIRAVAFAPDPELGPIDTPFGRLAFLQVVGITLDELRALKAWNAAGLLDLLRARLPLLLTDLDRASSLADPAFAAAVAERTAAEGSSTGRLFLSEASFRVRRTPGSRRRLELVLGATGARELRAVLPGRLPRGRGLTLITPRARIELVPGTPAGWRAEGEDRLVVTLPPDAALALVHALPERAGTIPLPGLDDAELAVEKSLIRDRDGRVVEEIG